jgi:protein-tyrosine phosphatase
MSQPTTQAPFRVLHVCTGNICRSPMAEHVMLARLLARFGAGHGLEVRSAGTYGGHAGEPMQPAAVEALAEIGVDGGGHRATWLREPHVDWADLVLTSSAEHRTAVLSLQPRALRRTFGLLELARLADQLGADDLPPGSPAERLRALVTRAPDLRGLHPAGSRTADDVADPYGQPVAAFRATLATLAGAVDRVVRPL